MEIVLLKNDSVRVKGKNATLIVDQQEKAECNASLVLNHKAPDSVLSDSEVVISGPGEYETGGIKITGSKDDESMIYNITVDSITLILGTITSIEKQQKLKEANILLVNCDSEMDASFLTGLVSNVIIFYGVKKTEIAKEFGKDTLKHLPKYTSTIDKLPTEVETVVLE